MSKNPIKPKDEEWIEFAELKQIKQDDVLVKGYCIPLDGRNFRIFVGNEVKRDERGYFLKLMYGWGRDTSIDLDKQKRDFPEATAIFRRYLPKAWAKGRTYFSYKYIMFGKGLCNKTLALLLLQSIVENCSIIYQIKQEGGKI
ncbi:MAG: hypothetical protein K6F72_07065 [Bacteroidales bacterium]|nr:hypothetical protein [Bacteroidales bacterium]